MKHKLFKIFTLGFLATTMLFFSSCSNDDGAVEETDDMDEETSEFKSGYIVNAYSSSSAGDVNFTGYFEDKPTDNIDLTQYTTFEQFNAVEVYKKFAFGRSSNGEVSLSRYSVDAETSEIEEVSMLTDDVVSAVNVINDELGLFTLQNEKKLYLFNPTTMELIRSIDVSNGKTVEGFYQTYLEVIYREQDNKAFMFVHLNDQSNATYYDANEVYVEVVNLDTFSWESTAVLTDAQYPFTRGATNNVVDESGNIYVTCQGSYSLDGQAGPTAANASRPMIAKIPSGSTTFDDSYRFNPANELGFTNLIAQFVTGTVYGANGIAYAAVSAKDDSPRVIELITAFALGTITQEEFDELRLLVLSGANSKWTKLDLNAQTATVIADIPFIAGFGFPYAYNYDGNILFSAYNPDEAVNGYYEYNPTTETSTNIFNVTGGGIVAQLVKLEE